MTNLQIYVIESLFSRNQITKEQLINAIETLPSDVEKNKFLTALIPKLESLQEQIEISQKSQKKKTKLHLIDAGIFKLKVIKVIKESLKLGLKEAKDLVDNCPILIDLENCPNQDVDIDKLAYQLQNSRATFRFL